MPSRYLLAASGVSPGHALRDLKALNPRASISTPPKEHDSFDPDNQKFLRNIQQRGRQVMIAEGLARSHRDFDAFLEDKVNMDWEDQRKKIFHHFGLSQKDDADEGMGASVKGSFGRSARQSKQPGVTPRGASTRRSVFGRSGLEKSVIGTPGAGAALSQLSDSPAERGDGTSSHSPDFRFLREKMALYAKKVQALNAARLQANNFSVLHEFSNVENHAGGGVSDRHISN